MNMKWHIATCEITAIILEKNVLKIGLIYGAGRRLEKLYYYLRYLFCTT